LLNGPDGHGQIDHSYETERIVLDIPKAWVVLGAWLAIKRHQHRHDIEQLSGFMYPY
jgi:hypothetical protein